MGWRAKEYWARENAKDGEVAAARGESQRIAREKVRAAALARPMSKLEKEFQWQWQAIQGAPLEREWYFHSITNWRFDFAHPLTMVAIECDGGTWKAGLGHSSGGGIRDGNEKCNEGQLQGWNVFRLTSDMIHIPILGRINALILKRMVERDAAVRQAELKGGDAVAAGRVEP